jgi:hypothetical protein
VAEGTERGVGVKGDKRVPRKITSVKFSGREGKGNIFLRYIPQSRHIIVNIRKRSSSSTTI